MYHPTYALAQVFICCYEGPFLHFCKIISQTICLHSFNGYAHFECGAIIIQNCFAGPLKSAGSVKDWLEYYVWRGLPLNSPVSLILHWVNGILSCAYVLMNEGLGFWNCFSRSLHHKLREAESSCKTNFLKCCNNIMIIKFEVYVIIIAGFVNSLLICSTLCYREANYDTRTMHVLYGNYITAIRKL